MNYSEAIRRQYESLGICREVYEFGAKIEEKLKEMGVCEGDTVILADWELEWYE